MPALAPETPPDSIEVTTQRDCDPEVISTMFTRTEFGMRPIAQALVVLGLAIAAPLVPAVAAPSSAPTFATVEQIQAVAVAVKHPVYWLGPRPGFNYELTVASTGRIFVRYLPKNAKLGDKRAIYKTVATYPVKNARAQLQAGAKFLKRPVINVGTNGLAVVSRPPTSVYVVFGTSNYQVEIFTPSAKLSKAAIKSVQPVGVGATS